MTTVSPTPALEPRTKQRLQNINARLGGLVFLSMVVFSLVLLALVILVAPNPILVLGLPMLLIGAYVCLAKIEWALVLLVFMTYTNLSDVLIENHGAPSVAKFFVPLLLLVVIGRWFLLNEPLRGGLRPLPLLLVWLGIGVLGLTYARDAAETQKALIALIKNILIAITVILLLRTGEDLRRAVWALLLAGIFLGTISVIQYIRADYDNIYWGFGRAEIRQIVGETSDYRISGPIGDSNSFGQVMLVLIPLALDRFLHERRFLLKALGGWAFVVSLLTVIFTYSRGAFIGLVAMGVLMVIFYARQPSSILATIILLGVVLYVAPPEYTERIRTIVNLVPGLSDDPVSEGSLRGRSSEIQSAWLMFRDYPFIGVGLGNYNEHYLDYSRYLGLDNRRVNRSAHSLYLETMAEQGIFGLLVLVALLGSMLYYIYHARNEFSASGEYDYANIALALGIGVVGYLTSAMFLHDAYPRFFWLIFGLCYALPQVVKYETRYYDERSVKQV